MIVKYLCSDGYGYYSKVFIYWDNVDVKCFGVGIVFIYCMGILLGFMIYNRFLEAFVGVVMNMGDSVFRYSDVVDF